MKKALVVVTDSNEQQPLVFPAMTSEREIKHKRMSLPVGDYGLLRDDIPLDIVIERKSIPDLFSSFSSNYDRERNKILKAREMDWKYILAIEGTVTRVLRGHTYWDGEQEREHQKSGISQLRQLLTISIRYGVEVWFCKSREEMALKILEYFLAYERNKK